jgi:HK97 family phage major capsid protein
VSELKTMDVSGDDVFSNVELDDSQGSDLSQESTVDKENASTLVSGSNEEIKSKEAEMPENDQVQQVLQVLEELRTEISNIKSTLPTVNTPVDVNVVKDEADQKFESFGQFLTAVKMAEIRPQDLDPRLKSREVKASGMSEAIPADGGYLLENSYAAGILEKMHPVGSLLSMVARDEIGANSNSMTYHGNDESSRADGSRWGGVRGYWLAEAGQKTSSQPKFKDITLKLKKVAALCYATDELLEDSTALQSWLTRVVPSELKFKAEDAIINGDGAGKPLGIMNAPCLISVSAETGQAATTIVYENIIKMWARRWAGVSDYVWLINQDTTPQLDTLVLAAGTAGIPPNFVTYGADGVMRIKGRPVIEVEYCATLGTVGDILLISPSQYQTIGKGGIAAASSIHVKFDYDETAFRFVYRMDGQPAWESALTPFKGSNTQSPFVALATRS